MGQSSELMIRMKEEEFYSIPHEIRQTYFQSKMVTPELNDWAELMQDEVYKALYQMKKKVSKDLDNRAYELREQKRKINNIEVNI